MKDHLIIFEPTLRGGRTDNGQGADTDILVASVTAYLNALNKVLHPVHREHPQAG